MYCESISINDILDIIAKLNNNKSPGPDMITPKLLKSIANEIINPLLCLFNLLLTTDTIPNVLKLAKAIPVHKKEDKYLASNYRPISLLNVIHKILEKTRV